MSDIKEIYNNLYPHQKEYILKKKEKHVPEENKFMFIECIKN
jgi:hypothetical protein